ncbi:MAG: zeta toxin family protein [Chthoniobacteraceae bacterium]
MTRKNRISKRKLKPSSAEKKKDSALLREFDKILRRDMNATLLGMRGKWGKIVLNADDLFKMLPRYKKNPAERIRLGPLLYPVAAKFTDDIYKVLLAAPVKKTMDTVVFTAGGSATGKSTILRAAGRSSGVDFIMDTTFSKIDRAILQVEKALASGRKVDIHYVYRDFSESVKGMVRRALDPKSGRSVPIDVMAQTHYGSQRAMLYASMQYQDNTMVSFKFYLNDEKKVKEIKLEKFYRLLHGRVDKLKKIGQDILDELLKNQGRRRSDPSKNQDARRKDLYISREFYEANRSKT